MLRHRKKLWQSAAHFIYLVPERKAREGIVAFTSILSLALTFIYIVANCSGKNSRLLTFRLIAWRTKSRLKSLKTTSRKCPDFAIRDHRPRWREKILKIRVIGCDTFSTSRITRWQNVSVSGLLLAAAFVASFTQQSAFFKTSRTSSFSSCG